MKAAHLRIPVPSGNDLPQEEKDLANAAKPPLNVVETAGIIFEHGPGIELISDAHARLKLLFFDGNSCTTSSQIKYRGRIYVPTQVEPSYVRAITFPTACASHGSSRSLFRSICSLITNQGFAADVALRVALFVFASWFADCLPLIPLLLVTGPGPEARLLLQILGCLTRHSLRLIDATSAILSRLPMDLQLTLIIDKPTLRNSTASLLAASNQGHSYLPNKHRLLNMRAGKALYLADLSENFPVHESMLRVRLSPTQMTTAILDTSSQQKIAAEFQPKLLDYRLRSFRQVRLSHFDAPELSSRLRVLAQILGRCIVDSPEIQNSLIATLGNDQRQENADRWLDVRCVIIEALLSYFHPVTTDRIHVAEITCTAETLLKGRGEPTRLEPRAVGAKLRELGLAPERDSKGFAIRLSTGVCRQVHSLGRQFNVAAVQEGIAKCPECDGAISS